MTKKELIEKLKQFSDDTEIYIHDMMNGNCKLGHVTRETVIRRSLREENKEIITLW